MCDWVYLPDKQNPNQRLCDKPGHHYCEEHQAEMDYIHRLDEDWKVIEATHRAVCVEPRDDEQQLCAACNIRPAHADCIYCADCCADAPLGVLGPQQ
jgi:hypothetical protein